MEIYKEETKFAEDLLIDFLTDLGKIDDEASHEKWKMKIDNYIDTKLVSN